MISAQLFAQPYAGTHQNRLNAPYRAYLGFKMMLPGNYKTTVGFSEVTPSGRKGRPGVKSERCRVA